MKFKILESYKFKDKYFYRVCRWDWLTRDMIHVYDCHQPRIITMDYWPQKIYLEANGKTTIAEFIHLLAAQYPITQIPANLDIAIIEELEGLIDEKLIQLSDSPILLEDSIMHPMTKEGVIDLPGTWKGIYTYSYPDENGVESTQEVKFRIEILSVNKDQFEGTVEDDLLTGGTPGIGDIRGNFNDFELSFEKKMPISARLEIDGSRSIDASKTHPAILYSGEFSRSKKVITGNWRFKKKVLVWRGIIPYWILPGMGTFSMEKVESTEASTVESSAM